MAPPLDHKQTAWLDGLRGTASLIVLFGHCSNFGVHVIPGLDLKWTAKTGVWLFFMLSAYLLGNKLAAIFASRTAVLAQLGDYAVRRVFRIRPLYAVVLGLFTLLGKLTAAVALQHVLLRVGADQFWTIPVEMKFYALLPVFVAVLSLLRPSTRLLGSVVLFGAFVIVFVLLPFPRVDSNSTSPLAYLSFFVLGLVVLEATKRGELRSRTAGLVAGLCTVAAMLLHPRALIAWAHVGLDDAWDYYHFTAIALAGLFYALAASNWGRRLMAARGLVLFGKYSFGLYLLHYALIPEVMKISQLPTQAKGAVVVATSLAAAVLAYHLVERPMISAGAQVSAWLRRSPRPQAQT